MLQPYEAIRHKIESSRKTRLAILLGGIAVSQFVLYGPSLVGAKILLPLDILARPGEYIPMTPDREKVFAQDSVVSDLVDLIEPERRLVASELRAGRWPMWNAGQYGGKPVLQGPWLSPLSILLSSTPSPLVLPWYQMLAALIAGAGFYAFCRRALGVGFWSATIPAWCYPMTGFFVFWWGTSNPNPAIWIPWLLLAVDRVIRHPSLSAAAAVGLVSCAGMCVRQLDSSAQLFMIVALYAAWRFCTVYWGQWFGGSARKAGLLVVGGCLLGACLAAPYVLPLVEYGKEADRLHRRVAGEEDRPPVGISALPLLVLPDSNGSTREGSYPVTAPFQMESLSTAYSGLIVTVFLAPLAWRSRRHRSFATFAAAVVYLSLAWCLNIGGIVMLLRLPPLNMMSHNRLVFAASFAILAMGAIGLDSLAEPVDESRRRWLLLPAALVALLSFWCFYRAVSLPEPIATQLVDLFSKGEVQRWIHDAAGVGRVQTTFRIVYLVGGLLAMVAALGWGLVALLRTWRGWLTAGVALAVCADMLWFAHGRSTQSDPALYYPRVPVLEQIAAKTTGRIIPVGCLPASFAQMSGLRDVRGYDGLDPSRYVRLLMLAAPPNFDHPNYALVQWMSPKWEQVPPDSVKLSPILDLLGVEYVIFRGSPPAGLKPPFAGDDYWALRNPSALPRVFVPNRAEIVPDEQQRLAKLGSPEFNPRAVVYLETPVDVPAPMRGRPTILHEKPTEVTVSVTMETPGLVVLADRWDRGWRARLNGESVPILVADHALRAVLVPEGTWILKFSCEPASFTWGLVLFGLATAVLAGGLGLGIRRRRAAVQT